jgi:hypothetical protein
VIHTAPRRRLAGRWRVEEKRDGRWRLVRSYSVLGHAMNTYKSLRSLGGWFRIVGPGGVHTTRLA